MVIGYRGRAVPIDQTRLGPRPQKKLDLESDPSPRIVELVLRDWIKRTLEPKVSVLQKYT
jgi:hypothetical protein